MALWAVLFTWSKLFELFDTALLVLRHRHEQIDVLQQMRNGRLQQQGGQGQVLVTPFRRFDIVEPVTQQGGTFRP